MASPSTPVSSVSAVESKRPVSSVSAVEGKPSNPWGCTSREFMAAYCPRLPAMVLYQNPAKAPTQPCLTCGRPVHSGLGRIKCHNHRDNSEPANGWAHLTLDEYDIISQIRQYQHLDHIADLLDDLLASILDIEARTSLTEESDSGSESVAILADAAGELNLGSGDEL
ncbi:hypothetical protein PHYPSEUDO_013009 [Phytophthora pseudosyringae]|uniref:Uncharacterized protein n=1 Tax=Phytophthora pseudosyringae TaxID=221518 RepID=A0A8T1VAS0_9STRA|nr:hypothetical protein PHYPSEUDO_013009 [Phytophthora pseudosyringae]